MATNTIELFFEECDPAPSNGYLVKYRPLGSSEAFRTVTPNGTSSPIVIVDDNDPEGTSYEGTIRGDCGGDYGVPVDWEAINENAPSASGSGSGSSSGEPPAIPCRTYILSATVGTPSAHYTDCFGETHDTLITSMTAICTNGHGFTISGGGITVESFIDGPCGDPYAYFAADEYECGDCFAPVATVVVRILRSELPLHPPKFYWAADSEATTNSYQLFGPELPPQSSIVLSGINTTLCRPC